MKVIVDGTEVAVAPGATLLDACQAAGVDPPTLCYGPTIAPKNACRVCVVELEGSRTLVPSCSRAAEDGMVVHTGTDRVRRSRRMVLELLASSVDLSSPAQAVGWIEEYGADPERQQGATVDQPVKLDNDLYVRDYAKCILCYQCVDACGEQWQGTFAIAIAGRGMASVVSTEWDAPLTESACVYCGNCVQVCPTGALVGVVEHTMRAEGTWAPERQAVTTTVCAFCGVGCNLELHTQDGRIVKVTSPPDHPVTHGNLCIKGRFGWAHVHG